MSDDDSISTITKRKDHRKNIVLILLFLFIPISTYYIGNRRASDMYDKGFLSGYSNGYCSGMTEVMSALKNIKDAKVYLGNLVIDKPYTTVSNCVFLYAKSVENGIYVRANNVALSNIMISGSRTGYKVDTYYDLYKRR